MEPDRWWSSDLKRRYRYLDPPSQLIVLLTLLLFIAALVVKGFTHDLLLEAGVFLVSVKLVIMAYKNAVANDSLAERLENIQEALRRLGKSGPSH